MRLKSLILSARTVTPLMRLPIREEDDTPIGRGMQISLVELQVRTECLWFGWHEIGWSPNIGCVDTSMLWEHSSSQEQIARKLPPKKQ